MPMRWGNGWAQGSSKAKVQIDCVSRLEQGLPTRNKKFVVEFAATFVGF